MSNTFKNVSSSGGPSLPLPAADVAVQGTYSNIPSSPTDLETAISELNTAVTPGAPIFTRVAPDISPANPGDNITLGAGSITLAGTVDGRDVSADGSSLDATVTKANNLITLSGVAANATNLGTFTGTTIPDSSTVKAALQSLETAVETPAVGSSLTSATDINAFIDNDATSTANRFTIYNDVTTPSAAKNLLTIQENRQNGMGTDTPFQDLRGTTADLASTDWGLHLKSTGANTSNLILDGTTPALWFADTSLATFKFFTVPSDGSLNLNQVDGALVPAFKMAQFMPSGIGATFSGGLSLGNTIPGGGFTGLWMTCFSTHPLQRWVFWEVATPRTACELRGAATSVAGDSYIEFKPAVSTSYTTPTFNAATLVIHANTTTALPGKVGMGSLTPTYPLDINPLDAGTTRIGLGGLAAAAGTGNAALIYRNLTATSTDSAVALVHQDHAADDQDTLQIRQDGTGKIVNFNASGTDLGDINVAGEMKIRTYAQAAEPVLTEDNHLAIWIDTDAANIVYLVFRRGSGDQVKLLFS